jgi:hypothetical protein
MGKHVAQIGEKRNTCRLVVGKPEGKRPLGKTRYKWMYGIKIDLGESGRGGVDWIGLAQDRDQWRALVNAVMNLLVKLNAGKFLSGCITCGLNSAQLHRVS